MSEAIRSYKTMYEELTEKFEKKLVGVPIVGVNEELQKKQFGGYKCWVDANGYLFYDLPTIGFSISTFEKIAEMTKHFEPDMFVLFSEYTHPINNEKGIEFTVKGKTVVLLHDRFLIRMIGIGPPEERHLSVEELADAFVKFYVEYGEPKKKIPKLDKTISVRL